MFSIIKYPFGNGGGGGGGATTFLALSDTPDTYTGQAGKVVSVNLAETTLEFDDIITVNLTSPQDGDIIVYDAANSEFINQPNSGGSLGIISRTVTGTTDTLLNSDKGTVIYFTNNSDITFTIPSGLDTNINVSVVQLGTGAIIFTEDTTTILNVDGFDRTKGAGSIVSIIGTPTTDTFVTAGQME